MKEGRKEVLKTNSQIKKLAIIRTIISVINIDIIVAALLFAISLYLKSKEKDLSTELWTTYICIFIMINIMFSFLIYMTIKQELKSKNNKIFIDMYFSQGEIVEVIPINTDESISSLIEKLEFYATINKKRNKIEIIVKLKNGCKSRYFQEINSRDFSECYKVKSDKQNNEKNKIA